MNTHDAGIRGRGHGQGQRTVAVADHDDLVRTYRGARCGGLVEDQSVSGIRCDEPRSFEIRGAPQRVEVDHVAVAVSL